MRLKTDHRDQVEQEKDQGDHRIVDAEFGERPGQGCQKREIMRRQQVGREVPAHEETAVRQPQKIETVEIDLVQVFGIKKEIRQAQALAQVAGDHGRQKQPYAQQEQVVAQMQHNQLERERVKYVTVPFSHVKPGPE